MKTPVATSMVSLLILNVILLTGCTEDPSSPNQEKPPVPVATADIGSQGGRLVAPDFELQVPVGAFTSTVTLSLYREPGEASFHSMEAFPVWQVAGLPTDYKKDLTVKIQDGDTTQAVPLLAIGEEVYVRSIADTRRGWRIHDCSIDLDWSVLRLPPLLAPAKDEPAETRQFSLFFSLTEELSSYVTPDRHFRIRFRQDLMTTSHASDLGRHLEEAYEELVNLGFDLSRRTRWPVDVTMTSFTSVSASLFGLAADSHLGDDYGWLEFDIQKLGDSAAWRLAAGHEMCHLVQGLYDPRPASTQASQAAIHSWLDEAVAVWIEALFMDDPSYRPPAWQEHQLQPFTGLQAGAVAPAGSAYAAATARNHGHGMAALIEYIAQRWNRAGLHSIYQHIALSKHPIEAIEEGVGESLAVWWDDFLRAYVQGSVYGLPWQTVTANSSDQFTVQSATDTVSSHTFDYPDLSGRIFLIDLAHPDLGSTAELQLQSDGGAYIISAFSYGADAEPLLLGHAPFVLTITNLRELTLAERDILILLTNNRREPPSYDESTQVTLSSRIHDHIDLPDFDGSSFSFRFNAQWQNDIGDSWETTDYDLRIAVEDGQFSGTTFFAQWDSTSAMNVHYLGEFSVELDPYSLTLTRWEIFSRTDFSESETFHFLNFAGGGIPLSIQQEDYLEYGVSGVGACEPVERVYAIQVNAGTIVQQLRDFNCDEGSFLDLVLEVTDSR